MKAKKKKVITNFTLHFLTVQIGNEYFQSNNSICKEKIQEKTKWLQMIYSSSLRISLPGNRASKSLKCVMTHGLSLFSTLNLINPFDTQKESLNLLVSRFFAFAPKHLVILTGRGCR